MELSEALTDNEFSLRDEVGAQYLAALDPADIKKLVQATVRAGDPKTFNAILASGALNDPPNAATAQQILVLLVLRAGQRPDRRLPGGAGLGDRCDSRRSPPPSSGSSNWEESAMSVVQHRCGHRRLRCRRSPGRRPPGQGRASASSSWRPVRRSTGTEAVEVFRQATAKVPESPYPYTARAPRPTVLDIGVPGTGYFVQDGPDPFGSTYERVVGGTTWHWLGTHAAAAAERLPDEDPVRGRRGLADHATTTWSRGTSRPRRSRRGRGRRQRPGLAPERGLPDAERCPPRSWTR